MSSHRSAPLGSRQKADQDNPVWRQGIPAVKSREASRHEQLSGETPGAARKPWTTHECGYRPTGEACLAPTRTLSIVHGGQAAAGERGATG